MSQQLPSDDEIVTFCRNQEALGIQSNTYVYPARTTAVAFIKSGSRKAGMMAEMLNQKFAFQPLRDIPESQRARIRIPEIYRVIEKDEILYVVMEYVSGKTFKQILDNKSTTHDQLQNCYDKIAQAIQLFLSFKVPDNIMPGPVGGGIVKHLFTCANLLLGLEGN